MARTTLNLSCVSSALIDSAAPTVNEHGLATYRVLEGSYSRSYRYALMAFDSFPQNLRRNRIYSASLSLVFERDLTALVPLKIKTLAAAFDQTTVTYNTAPTIRSNPLATQGSDQISSGSGRASCTIDIWQSGATDTQKSIAAVNAVKRYAAGFALDCGVSTFLGNYVDLYTQQASSSGLRPVIQIDYDSSIKIPSKISLSNSPTSGYVNPRTAQKFRWTYTLFSGGYYCYDDYTDVVQSSATFYWREGSSGSWRPITISGDNKNVTVPANTFPAGSTVQFYVSGTDSYGDTSQTEIYTLSTSASEMVAQPLAPNGSVEDGSGPIAFSWSSSSSDGYPQNGADLQTSTDGETWVNLGSATGSARTYTAPAGQFESGETYWRVRGYNVDGSAGPWSEPAGFIVVAAPPAPSVTVDAAPFATISWQAEGQQAYRITVDGKQYGPFFGTVKSFQLSDFLPDGEHSASVEIQGVYGIWSQAGTATFVTQNAPGASIVLSGVFDRDAFLSWTSSSSTEDFLIYRDGVQIGHTAEKSFTDRVSLGAHSWQVINRLPSGNYTASNTVQGVLSTEELAIALLSGGEWLELTKSRNPTRQETYSLSQNVSLTHFAGQEYPEAEASPYKTLQGSFDVSWNRDEPEQAAAFEAMIGKPIIYKAPSGETLVGIMAAIQKNPINFFKAYTATVQRIHWRDFVDADN